MKKKVILTVALVLVVALCALTFVACTPNNVGDYFQAMKDTKHGTVKAAGAELELQMDFVGQNIHIVTGKGIAKMEAYLMVEGDKKIMYTSTLGIWTKSDVTKTIADLGPQFNPSEMLKEIDLDKANYDVVGKVWTHKTDKTAYTIEKGELVMSVGGKEMGRFSVKKPTIKLPKEAKEAKEGILPF